MTAKMNISFELLADIVKQLSHFSLKPGTNIGVNSLICTSYFKNCFFN